MEARRRDGEGEWGRTHNGGLVWPSHLRSPSLLPLNVISRAKKKKNEEPIDKQAAQRVSGARI